MHHYYEYQKYNHIAIGLGKRWGVLSFYLSFTGGIYFEVRLGKLFIDWTHHGKQIRKELMEDENDGHRNTEAITPEAILAEDWVVAETKVEITESEFDKACCAAISPTCAPDIGINLHAFITNVKRELFGKKEK